MRTLEYYCFYFLLMLKVFSESLFSLVSLIPVEVDVRIFIFWELG